MRFDAVRKHALVGKASWMFAAQAARALSQAGYFVLLARSLGVSGLGAYAACLAVIAAVMPFAGFGSGNVLLMRAARDPAVVRVLWGNALVITFAGTAILLVCASLFVGIVLSVVPVGLVLLLGTAEFFFGRVAEIAAQAFQSLERAALTALVASLSSVARFGAAVAFSATHGRGTAMQWGSWYLAASIVAAIAATAITAKRLGLPSLSLADAKHNVGTGLYFSLALAATTIYTDIDKVMLAQLATLAAAGAYTAAYRVVSLAFVPVFALLLATLPRFFQRGAAGVVETAAYAKRLLLPASLYACIAGVVLYVCAGVVPMLLGDEYRGSVDIIQWLSPLPFLLTVYYLGADALTGADLQRLRSVVQIVAALGNVLLNIWLIGRYGQRGAAWSTLLTYGALAGAVWVALAHRRRGVISGEVRLRASSGLAES